MTDSRQKTVFENGTNLRKCQSILRGLNSYHSSPSKVVQSGLDWGCMMVDNEALFLILWLPQQLLPNDGNWLHQRPDE